MMNNPYIIPSQLANFLLNLILFVAPTNIDNAKTNNVTATTKISRKFALIFVNKSNTTAYFSANDFLSMARPNPISRPKSCPA